MTQVIPEQWAEVARQFEQLEQSMTNAGWFKQAWKMRWHYTNDQYGEGIGCQLSKSNWYNENENGIHFDAFVRETTEENPTITVMLHVHSGFPKPAEFIQLFVAENSATLENWGNAKIMPNHPLMPFLLKVPYTANTIAEVLEAEYNRLRQLEQPIDRTIAEVL
jgi:hypothetical protein